MRHHNRRNRQPGSQKTAVVDTKAAMESTSDDSSTKAAEQGGHPPARENKNLDTPVLLTPQYYAHNNGFQRKFSNWVLDFCQALFRRETDETQQFLDLGCGTGDFTRECLLPRCLPCRRMVAVDLSADMIDYARSHWVHDALEFRKLDITVDEHVADLLGEYGAFDRVYSFHCLHWALNQPAALKNVARLLKPGGECLLVFHASLQAMDVCRNITKIERWSKYAPVVDRFVPATQDMDDCERIEYASKLLKEAGLSPSILELPRCTVFDGCSLDTLLGVYITLNPVADILPDEEKMAAVKDTVELIRTMHSSDADKSRYRVYVIKASKM
ncbi:juvenile hormone acid O-methyltransferase-like [Dermacentor andersoni]|uniref:juvenile hormone acid O-methyltransferase-like n=1 Tax=Dermacentor andersoni TaxID=34620 RepID=UPI002155A9B0|nr:juvenile hormone acid O-methyltransferase-like [Dermacentor andersoni]XP_054933760.1 juvenile hormone acid O-methyltransferase-like [Dermacentor andersoni]